MEVEVEVGYQQTMQNDSTDSESGRKSTNLLNTPIGSHVSLETTTFTMNNVPVAQHRKIPAYKEVYIDVDVGKKSDRPEWGHVRYQSVYKPTEAFEMTVQWVQSTGAIVTELVTTEKLLNIIIMSLMHHGYFQVQGWSRKAQQCNLQLVPVPCDPYALPYSSESDSLRGPIFIPLNVECLMDSRSYLFEGVFC